jgi:uncharacterized protein (TIGR03086 family)
MTTDTRPVYRSSIELPVSPDEAFALITEPERLRRWSAVCATVDLRAGGSYRWQVTPSHAAGGTIREVDPGRRVVFGWGWLGDDGLPPDASTVTLTVEPTDNGSRVTLTHEGLPDQQSVDGHAEGWDHYLERLERFGVTGDAGQDEWAWAPEGLDPIVAGYAALAVIQPMLRRLTPEDQPKPTPCTEMTCHQVAVHLMESLVSLGAMAGVGLEIPAEGSLETKVSTLADRALSAWRDRGLEGTVSDPGGNELPAALGPAVIDVELLLHGWDLAQGSGQTLDVSDEVVGYVAELAVGLIEGGRGSAFADELTPDEGASALDRLAAYSGRTSLVPA